MSVISTALHSPKCLEKGSTPEDDDRTDEEETETPDDGAREGATTLGDTDRVGGGATLDEGGRTVEGVTVDDGGRTEEGALEEEDGGVGAVTLVIDERVTDDGATGAGRLSGASALLSAAINFLYRADVVLSVSYRMVR